MVQLLLLSDFLQHRLEGSYSLSDHEYLQTLNDARDHIQQLKNEIYSLFGNMGDKQLQAEYLQAVMGGLNLLSANVFNAYNRRGNKKNNVAQDSFFREIASLFTDTMDLFRYMAPQTFDEHRQAPLSAIIQLKETGSSVFKNLYKIQRLLDEHTAELVPLLQQLIDECISIGPSYKQARYLNDLLIVLGRLRPIKGNDINFLVHYHLIFNNFNHPDYILFCNGKLGEKYGNLPAEQRANTYREYELQLNQILPSKEVSLLPALPPTRDSLLIFLTGELDHMIPAYPPPLPHKKLPLNLSAAQLALFVRILQKMSAIPDHSQMAIFRFCAEHISTKGTEHNSIESMRAKGANPTVETAVSIIELCHQVISNARSFVTR